MKKHFLFIGITIGLIVLLASCAPQAVPSSTPAPPPVAPSRPIGISPAPTPIISSEEAAWARIVEAAKKEGQVNVYTWGWTGDIGLAISKKFENRYGIKLNLITGRGAEFLERIKTEHRMGRVVADIWEGSSSHSENMKLAGLLAPSADLPVLREKEAFIANPLHFGPEGHYLAENQYYVGLFVNTKLVKPGEEPKAWVDLLDPRWKGNIVVPDPAVSNCMINFAILIDEGRLTLEFLEKLGKQELKFDPSTPGVAIKVAKGEAALGITTTSGASPVALEGAPIKIVDTREGIIVDLLGIGRVKDGPNPNATRVLLNWMLSQEGQDAHSKAKGTLSVRKDVADYQPQGMQLKPQNPVFASPKHNALMAQIFRDKQYVPLLRPK